jgi:hypothetical protein
VNLFWKLLYFGCREFGKCTYRGSGIARYRQGSSIGVFFAVFPVMKVSAGTPLSQMPKLMRKDISSLLRRQQIKRACTN